MPRKWSYEDSDMRAGSSWPKVAPITYVRAQSKHYLHTWRLTEL